MTNNVCKEIAIRKKVPQTILLLLDETTAVPLYTPLQQYQLRYTRHFSRSVAFSVAAAAAALVARATLVVYRVVGFPVLWPISSIGGGCSGWANRNTKYGLHDRHATL